MPIPPDPTPAQSLDKQVRSRAREFSLALTCTPWTTYISVYWVSSELWRQVRLADVPDHSNPVRHIPQLCLGTVTPHNGLAVPSYCPWETEGGGGRGVLGERQACRIRHFFINWLGRSHSLSLSLSGSLSLGTLSPFSRSLTLSLSHTPHTHIYMYIIYKHLNVYTHRSC